MAAGQSHFLDNVITHILSAKANGYEGPHPGTIPPVWPVSMTDKCSCEAAVSPLAYLADLLDYAVRHVKNNGSLVNLQFLTDTFHQPFGSLPTACDEMDKPVRQVRLCIEVLRSYLKANNILIPQQIETDYCLDAYTTLLNKIGTSYAEIRLARTDTPEKRQSLEDRLGIDLNLVGANLKQVRPDYLDNLFIDAEANPAQIIEPMLEQLFGLVDTTRDPLAAGPSVDFLDWRLKHLRTFWKVQDWPVDLYSGGVLPLELQALPRPPIIDPDLIGPDDFRNPVAKPTLTPGSIIRSLAETSAMGGRAVRCPGKKTKQVNNQSVPDLVAMPGAMYQPVSYGTIQKAPWVNATAADWTAQPNNHFEALLDQLT
jgi:hypothetical protein